MIRINLLGEKVDRTSTYALELLGYISCLVLTVGLCFLVHDGVKNKQRSLADEREHLRNRLAKLERTTKEVEDLEKKRKTLQEKLQTIALLKAKKHGPVHVLDSVNTSIPERAWLTSTKEKGGVLEINGIALDNQTIAAFMANLQQHKDYFGEVGLVVSTETITNEVKLKEFTLAVQLLDPLTKKPIGNAEDLLRDKRKRADLGSEGSSRHARRGASNWVESQVRG